MLNKDEGDVEMGDVQNVVEHDVPNNAPAMIHYDYVEPPPMPHVEHVPLDHVF